MTISIAEDLLEFIDASPSPYHCVAEAAKRLTRGGWTETTWDAGFTAGSRGFVRVGGALIGWSNDEAAVQPIVMIGAHTDSPNLRITPRPDLSVVGVRQLGISPYGGVLANSWLDRDLGLSGRVVVRSGDGVDVRLMRDDRPLLRVPQLAIHLDRTISSEGLKLDPSRHLTPVWGLGASLPGEFAAWLAGAVGVEPHEVVGWDVMCHDTLPAGFLGADEELISAPRIDNQASCFGAVSSLIDVGSRAGRTLLIALFDHEEVGSASATGAGGALLPQVLERLTSAWGGDAATLANALGSGQCMSADMAHATHPNYPERHDPSHQIALGGGPVVKVNVNQRYATDGPTAGRFRALCDGAGIPHQTYSHRNDLQCGSTIGPITAAQLGIPTIDVGMPQLSMHSIRELMATRDVDYMVETFSGWFEHV